MERHQKKMKKVRKGRIFWFILFPVLLFLGVGLSYGTYLFKKAETMLESSYEEVEGREEKSILREEKVDPKIDNVSILFIGVDESEKRGQGETSLSDALILATLNEEEKTVNLLNIPRDSYVYIEEVGYHTKINHAHAFGGPKATIETVENLLDVPVDYYVRMDFDAFTQVVDALNGIDMDVPFDFSEQDSSDRAGAISLQAGLQTLNGEEALALARTRKIDNDIERGKRQQEIMKAILKKAVSGQSVTKYGQVIDAIGSNMKTNMTFDEMTSFLEYGVSSNLTVETMTIAGADSYIRNSSGQNIYYWQLNDDSVKEAQDKLKGHLKIVDKADTNGRQSNEIAAP